jgi:transcriptional regulator with XRE-family HTH domain
MEDLRQIFATNLRLARHERRLSQEALAQETGISRSYMSDIERGATWVRLEIIGKLAGVLEIEAYELLMPRPKRGRRTTEKSDS